MNTLKIKKLHPDAILPTRAHSTDAGLDLYALGDYEMEAGTTTLIKTGISVDVPEGYEAQVRPRSGLTLKTPVKVQLGTIDCGYRGDVGVITHVTESYVIREGEKIAQLVISPIVTPSVEIVEEFESESARGANGFGSTGK